MAPTDMQLPSREYSSSSSSAYSDESSNGSFTSEYDDEEVEAMDNVKVATHQPTLVDLANAEIEQLRQRQEREEQRTCPSSLSRGHKRIVVPNLYKFPHACWSLIRSMPGNQRCVDCGARHPTWAAVSYGALLCLQCSGHHRSLGVQVSCVRSVQMDEWSLPQIVAMLEGGNTQLHSFFDRHCLSEHSSQSAAMIKQQHQRIPSLSLRPQQHSKSSSLSSSSSSVINKDNVTRLRYKTKAALFYRQQLSAFAHSQFDARRPRDFNFAHSHIVYSEFSVPFAAMQRNTRSPFVSYTHRGVPYVE